MDTLLDADQEAPISSLYKDVSEEELREAAADCRAFARLEERGLVDELVTRYGDLCKYWNLVMGERQWAKAKEDAYARLPIPPRPEDALAGLQARFAEAAGAAAQGPPRNLFTRIQDGELRL